MMRRRGGSGRLLIAGIMALVAIGSYVFGARQLNPITGENQRVDLTREQEIALGLEAAPVLAQEFGGLHPDVQARAAVDQIGRRVVQESSAASTNYEYAFHLLADEQTINAFALPGGQIFITAGLYNQLQTEGELAGVLAHEVGHVVGRHSSEQLAKSRLVEGLTGAAVIAAYDPDNPNSISSAQMAALIGNMVNMKFGRDDELESDRLGVRFLAESGYDPRALIRVMEVLASASQGPRPPEFFSTHPNPENRIGEIEAAIQEEFPNGVPEGLIK
jgi:beta-barrel assembly-enhancing protease